MTPVLIALAGAVGTLLRYGVQLGVVALAGTSWPSWPWATLLVNVLGSFAIGVVFELGEGRQIFGSDLRLVLGTGLLGGFTTYSAFNLETIRLWQSGAQGRAAGYVLATLVVCLVAGAAGMALARTVRARG